MVSLWFCPGLPKSVELWYECNFLFFNLVLVLTTYWKWVLFLKIINLYYFSTGKCNAAGYFVRLGLTCLPHQDNQLTDKQEEQQHGYD